MDDARLRLLVTAKLRALVRSTGVEPVGEAWAPPGVAGVTSDDGHRWFTAVGDATALGATLLAVAHDPGPATVVVDPGDDGTGGPSDPARVGELSRRLAAFADPPAVARVQGTTLVDVSPLDLAGAVAGELPRPRPGVLGDPGLGAADADRVRALLDAVPKACPPAVVDAEGFVSVISVRGLEVARVVAVDGRAYLDLGVGEHDRQAGRDFGGDVPLGQRDLAAELARVELTVAAVLEHRGDDTPPHPLARLRVGHWLRAAVIVDPTLAGFPAGTRFVAGPDPVLVATLRDAVPAVALADGAVVVCGAGTSPELVPHAVAAWLEAATVGEPWPRLALVMPAADAHPFHLRLVAALRPELGAGVVTVPDDWRRRAP